MAEKSWQFFQHNHSMTSTTRPFSLGTSWFALRRMAQRSPACACLATHLGKETPEISWTTTKAYRTGDHALIDNLNDQWCLICSSHIEPFLHTFHFALLDTSKDSQTRYSMVTYGTVFFSPFPYVPLSKKRRFALKDSPSRPALLWSRGRKSKLPDLRVAKPKCSELSWHETEKTLWKVPNLWKPNWVLWKSRRVVRI